MSKKIVVIASLASSLVNFRLQLMQTIQACGYEITACAPHDTKISEYLNGLGIRFIPIPLERNGRNPVHDLSLLYKLFLLLRSEKPDIVFSYTIKPVIFGSTAAYLAGIRNIYSMITGTGYIFVKETFKNRLVGSIAKKMFKCGLLFNKTVIFQNKDNKAQFLKEKLISKNKKMVIVNGSGVDLDYFATVPVPQTLSFIMISRLLQDKGVREYVHAARILKQKYPSCVFKLAGWIDTNPNSIQEKELNEWINEGTIEFLGKLNDVRPALSETAVYVLPSYAEGTPRSVLEAMSVGRPVITTDAPGCRETVVNAVNGFLVPIRNTEALANAMQYFYDHPEAIAKMGEASRQIAIEKYDVRKVNKAMLEAMSIEKLPQEFSMPLLES